MWINVLSYGALERPSRLVIIRALFLIGIVSFLESCTELKCPEFEYDSFGLDTSLYKRDFILHSGKDSLLFRMKSWEPLHNAVSMPTFFTADGCADGIAVTYITEEANMNFTLYVIMDTAGYSSGFYSFWFSQAKRDLKSIEDIIFTVNVGEDTTKRPCPFVRLEVVRGRLQGVVDQDGKAWRATSPTGARVSARGHR